MLFRSRSRRSLLPIAYRFSPVPMVSDSMVKVRFPPAASSVRFFSPQESHLPGILHSKTFFH
jgi:hypothetical protein